MQDRDVQPQSQSKPGVAGYEKRDANARWIFGIFAFLLLSMLAMHFAIGAILRGLAKTPAPTDRWSDVRVPFRASEQPPAPRLQISPAMDLKDFRAREDAELNTYGWVNQTSGIVRIPIERAMELVLQRGLPARTGSNGDVIGPSNYELQQRRPQEMR